MRAARAQTGEEQPLLCKRRSELDPDTLTARQLALVSRVSVILSFKDSQLLASFESLTNRLAARRISFATRGLLIYPHAIRSISPTSSATEVVAE